MEDKNKRPVYKPPRARDLSSSSVSGGKPKPYGICQGGSVPYTNCDAGPAFAAGACSPVGNLPDRPTCKGGSNALVGCIVGGQA